MVNLPARSKFYRPRRGLFLFLWFRFPNESRSEGSAGRLDLARQVNSQIGSTVLEGTPSTTFPLMILSLNEIIFPPSMAKPTWLLVIVTCDIRIVERACAMTALPPWATMQFCNMRSDRSAATPIALRMKDEFRAVAFVPGPATRPISQVERLDDSTDRFVPVPPAASSKLIPYLEIFRIVDLITWMKAPGAPTLTP